MVLALSKTLDDESLGFLRRLQKLDDISGFRHIFVAIFENPLGKPVLYYIRKYSNLAL